MSYPFHQHNAGLRRLATCSFIVAAFACSTVPGLAKDKGLVNGNFEAGDTGFSSQYTSVSELCNANGLYTVASNPADVNCYGDWASFGDHTTGSGLMMIIDGATSAGQVIWSETVKVRPNTRYKFGFWSTSADGTDNGSATAVQAYINGTAAGDALQLPDTYDGKWHHAVVSWNSGSNKKVTLSLVDLDTAGPGNDFVLDDISLKGKKK